MKYGFIQLEINDGEHGYYSSSVVEYKRGPIEQVAIRVCKTWYEDERIEEETPGVFEYPMMGVIVQVNKAVEITKEHYDILSQYI